MPPWICVSFSMPSSDLQSWNQRSRRSILIMRRVENRKNSGSRNQHGAHTRQSYAGMRSKPPISRKKIVPNPDPPIGDRSFQLTPRRDFSKIAPHKPIPFFTSPAILFRRVSSSSKRNEYRGEVPGTQKAASHRRTRLNLVPAKCRAQPGSIRPEPFLRKENS